MKQNNTLSCNIIFEGPQPMLILDPISMAINQVNTAALTFFEYSEEILLKKKISDLFLSDITNIVTTAGYSQYAIIIKSDGCFVQRHLTSFMLRFSDKDFVCIIISPSDAIPKTASEEIHNSSNFNLLFSKHPIPGIIFDRKTRKILLVNEAASELYGYPHEEFCSKKLDDIKAETELPIFSNKLESLAPGRYFKTVAYHKTKNKNTMEVEIHTRPYELENQQAAISFINDITGKIPGKLSPKAEIPHNDGRTSDKCLNNTIESQNELSSLKSIVLSNMSHELRTPLVGILGYSDILKSEVASSELKQMADAIHTSGEKLLTDLNMVLNLSAIEVGMTKLLYSETDMCRIIQKVIKKFEDDAERKDIFLKFNSSFKELIVKTDKELVYDALYYVLDNAVKFTNKGGITIELDFTLVKQKPYYKIQINDTGLGISEEQQQIIFETFRQISEGTNRIFGGLGIGLTVAKKIVNMFGGELTFVSNLNEGSNFTFLLPA